MKDFAAIDFETANEQRTSVCSVGVVIVRDGEIVDHYYNLIRPEPEYYTYWNTRVHGLTLADTRDAPIFPVVWQEIAPRIEGLPLVAHNKAFDESCLKAVFRTYCMDYPDYEFPIFPVVWQEIAPRIEGLPLVAHNKAFDESCLKAVFRTYCMDYPDYEFHCTLQASRRVLKGLPNYQLHTVAACCGYQLEQHHHALADAEACAWIAKQVI